MNDRNKRRSFLKKIALGSLGAVTAPTDLLAAGTSDMNTRQASMKENRAEHPASRSFNSSYTGEYLNRVAFPIGGLGAGMFCLEGTGAISHMSVRHRPEIFHEPAMFAAIALKGDRPQAKVLEGPVPERKLFGERGTGNGAAGTTFGLPRFRDARFDTEFPFGNVELSDRHFPLTVSIRGWSPFIPGNEDDSSLPVGSLEYTFTNNGPTAADAVFSYNSRNFLASDSTDLIKKAEHGFVLHNEGSQEKSHLKSSFAIFTDETETKIDYCWFRGGWWDPLTMAWNSVKQGIVQENEPVAKGAPGASLYVPFSLAAGASRTIRLYFAWYTPRSDLHIGENNEKEGNYYKPWYGNRFEDINSLISYWKAKYDELRRQTQLFANSFYASTLAPEVMEAVAANLSILKSPTVLRQTDGRLWSWEGCGDDGGCCHGSCTHVWNYAQALPHLFPSLERSLRDTEFIDDQNREGHQAFRANLPVGPVKHDFHAAADGQLGGIMKVYRDWRISGNTQWLKKMYPRAKDSLDYCIETWDPRRLGVLEEPHHNTYDIEFWGPDGMCTSFYLGALYAFIEMSRFLKTGSSVYSELLRKGKAYCESRLFNGEYFFQEIKVDGLNAPDPAKAQSFGGEYSKEAIELLKKEGPKYQYGTGCLSDGVLGAWMARVCGLPDILDAKKITSHLEAVHKYNLKRNLSEHENPQRPAYALGNEGGLLLCTWPKGGELSLPFVYSNEVWTGIEYQAASHLMMMGKVDEGLEIVRECRKRYDGRVRNPFNEYECGHWYARAMSSYSMIQGLTGLWYDNIDQTLHIDSKIGDFVCFLSTAGGFGTVEFTAGKPVVNAVYGKISVSRYIINSKEQEAG